MLNEAACPCRGRFLLSIKKGPLSKLLVMVGSHFILLLTEVHRLDH